MGAFYETPCSCQMCTIALRTRKYWHEGGAEAGFPVRVICLPGMRAGFFGEMVGFMGQFAK